VTIDINQLVNLTSAASLCGMSRRRFYDYLEGQRGPTPVRIDGHQFFDRDNVIAWNKSRLKSAKRKTKP
jgi:predicted DNA-binding transcriptional regulator AlpA